MSLILAKRNNQFCFNSVKSGQSTQMEKKFNKEYKKAFAIDS